MRKLVLAVVACAAAACGGISTKEDAAKALGTVVSASQAAGSSRAGSSLAPVGGEIDANVTLPGRSGSVTVTGKLSFTANGLNMDLTLKYVEYSPDGVATLDGEIAYKVTTSAAASGGSATASASVQINGAVSLSGTDHDGDLELAITMTTDIVMTGTGGGGSFSAKARLDGTIKADGNTFTYANEEFAVFEGSASAG